MIAEGLYADSDTARVPMPAAVMANSTSTTVSLYTVLPTRVNTMTDDDIPVGQVRDVRGSPREKG